MGERFFFFFFCFDSFESFGSFAAGRLFVTARVRRRSFSASRSIFLERLNMGSLDYAPGNSFRCGRQACNRYSETNSIFKLQEISYCLLGMRTKSANRQWVSFLRLNFEARYALKLARTDLFTAAILGRGPCLIPYTVSRTQRKTGRLLGKFSLIIYEMISCMQPTRHTGRCSLDREARRANEGQLCSLQIVSFHPIYFPFFASIRLSSPSAFQGSSCSSFSGMFARNLKTIG